MHSSPPYPPYPPQTASPLLPFTGIFALVLLCAVLSYLIIDFIDENEEINLIHLNREHSSSGLSSEETEALPWFDCEANISTTNCAICLDCFQKGQRCRSFPICRHTFHAACIDLWLVRRLTCPTCRSPFTTGDWRMSKLIQKWRLCY